TSKITLFARYNYSPSNLDQRGPNSSVGNVLSQVSSLESTVHTGTTGVTQSITPGIGNEARANYSNQRIGLRYTVDAFGGAAPLSDSVLFPVGYTSANAVFDLYIPGAGVYYQGLSLLNEQRQVNLIDNLSVVKAGHQLKFGVDYRWLSPFVSPFAYRQFVQFLGMSAAPGAALSGTAQIAATGAQQGNAFVSH